MAVRKEPLLDTDTTLAIIYIVIMGFALLVGTCGNALILLVSAIMRGINKSGKEFILNLAIADLCVTAIADPLCIVGVYSFPSIFLHLHFVCKYASKQPPPPIISQ